MPLYDIPVALASMRAKIYLTRSDIVDELCSFECLDEASIDAARNAIDRVYSAIADIASRVKEALKRRRTGEAFLRSIDIDEDLAMVIEDLKKLELPRTGCKVYATLGCYISEKTINALSEAKHRNITTPAILVALDRIEDVASTVENFMGVPIDDYRRYRLKLTILRSVLTHEVTHSFIDAGGGPPQVDRSTRIVIEESLATYYQLMLLDKLSIKYPVELEEAFRFAIIYKELPPEYRASLVWRCLDGYKVDEVLELWSRTYVAREWECIEEKLYGIVDCVLKSFEAPNTLRKLKGELRELGMLLDYHYCYYLYEPLQCFIVVLRRLKSSLPRSYVNTLEKLFEESIGWKILALTLLSYTPTKK